MPVYSLLLVCVLSLQLHTRPRVQRAPGIPHALHGREINANLGRIARRGRGRVFESTSALRSLWSEVTTHYRLRHSGMRRQAQASDAQLRIGESRDSGFDAEPVIGPRFARTRWHRPGMTVMDLRAEPVIEPLCADPLARNDDEAAAPPHGAAQENVAATLPNPDSSITTLSPAVSQIV